MQGEETDAAFHDELVYLYLDAVTRLLHRFDAAPLHGIVEDATGDGGDGGDDDGVDDDATTRERRDAHLSDAASEALSGQTLRPRSTAVQMPAGNAAPSASCTRPRHARGSTYLAGTEPGRLGILRRKLLAFLESSVHYHAEKMLSRFPAHELLHERAILLGTTISKCMCVCVSASAVSSQVSLTSARLTRWLSIAFFFPPSLFPPRFSVQLVSGGTSRSCRCTRTACTIQRRRCATVTKCTTKSSRRHDTSMSHSSKCCWRRRRRHRRRRQQQRQRQRATQRTRPCLTRRCRCWPSITTASTRRARSPCCRPKRRSLCFRCATPAPRAPRPRNRLHVIARYLAQYARSRRVAVGIHPRFALVLDRPLVLDRHLALATLPRHQACVDAVLRRNTQSARNCQVVKNLVRAENLQVHEEWFQARSHRLVIDSDTVRRRTIARIL